MMDGDSVLPGARFVSRFVSRDLARRDFSLDVFRGLMIVGMIFVNHPPPDVPTYAPFAHAAWHGWTLADTIFPGFLFTVGVSIRLAMADDRGRPLGPSASLLRRLLARFGLLMLLNLLLVNFPYYWWGKLHFTGTLALIAWCYLFAALIYLYAGWRAQWVLIVAALGLQWAVLALLPVPGYGAGVLSPDGNAASYVDRLALSWLGPRDAPDVNIVIVPMAGAVSTTVIGVLAGHWLRGERERNARLAGLFTAGMLLLMLGSAWEVVLPINKQLWSGSYVVFMAGLSMQLLAGIKWLAEHCRYQGWAIPLRVAGANALVLYLLAQSLQRVLVYGRVTTEEGTIRLRHLVYQRFFEPFVARELGALVYTLVFMLLCYSVVFVLYRRRIFLKL